jgi:predicted  nucleic acid-binding Zn-ribbon protein
LNYFANPLALYTNRLYNFIMSQSSSLYRLQQIDSQIDQTHTRIQEIEMALSSNPALKQAQEYVNETEHSFQDAHKTLQKAEDTVQDQRIKINQVESVLYGGKVSNPKELQDLQNDVGSLKRYLSVLEDRQLEAMLTLEDAENKYQLAIKQLDETLAKTTEQQAGLRGELTQLLKLSERLDVERQLANNAIGPDDLALYEQLRQTRRGIAIAKVSSQACGACGSLLTPALVQAANSPTQLVRCTSCGRILYAG